jgi:hypothetical protein
MLSKSFPAFLTVSDENIFYTVLKYFVPHLPHVTLRHIFKPLNIYTHLNLLSGL